MVMIVLGEHVDTRLLLYSCVFGGVEWCRRGVDFDGVWEVGTSILVGT